jgi:hypothetical protein
MDESDETIPTDPPAEMDAEELAEAYQQTVELLGRLKACETARASTASTAPKGLADRVQKAVRVLRGDPPTTSTDELKELARLADEGSETLEARAETLQAYLVGELDDSDSPRGFQ